LTFNYISTIKKRYYLFAEFYVFITLNSCSSGEWWQRLVVLRGRQFDLLKQCSFHY